MTQGDGKDRRFAAVCCGIIFVVSATLLFFRLGHYALWDDETMIALGAKGVLATGDTTAIIGDNVLAYRSGIALKNLHDRFTPPLPTYLVAASMGLFGTTAGAARLPFALCALATVAVALRWLWQHRPTRAGWVLWTMAITGCAPFFLYSRQARYYAPVMLLSVLIAYWYVRWKNTRGQAIGISLAAAALYLCQPIAYVQVAAIAGLDYLIWGRKSKSINVPQLLWLIIPQFLIIAGTSIVWSPFHTRHEAQLLMNTLADRFVLLWWNLRDINQGELGIGLLLIAAVAIFLLKRNAWPGRCLAGVLVTVIITTVISHQVVSETKYADIRYLLPVLPLCLTAAVLVLVEVSLTIPWLALVLGFASFYTNLLQGGPLQSSGLHSTMAQFIGELRQPPPEPYSPTAAWIRDHVPKGASVWVLPDYMTYPLMFHAPDAIYAWQIDPKLRDPQFAKLPRIHFQGEIPPDYIVLFGPVVQQMMPNFQQWSANGLVYEHLQTIDVFWKDLYRPELFWRTFKPVENYNRPVEAINVFRRVKPPILPAPATP